MVRNPFLTLLFTRVLASNKLRLGLQQLQGIAKDGDYTECLTKLLFGVRWEGVLPATPLWLGRSRGEGSAALAGGWVEWAVGDGPGNEAGGLRRLGIELKRCRRCALPPHSKSGCAASKHGPKAGNSSPCAATRTGRLGPSQGLPRKQNRLDAGNSQPVQCSPGSDPSVR